MEIAVHTLKITQKRVFCKKSTTMQGFSLLEFMLSLSLGLCLLALLFTFYGQLQRNYRLMMGLSEISENAQVALAWLSRDIRMAGFMGCPSLAEIAVVGKPRLDVNNSLIGWHKSRSTSQQPIPISAYDPENDVLQIQFAEAKSYPIRTAEKQHIDFQSSLKRPFELGEILLISDCKKAEIFRWKMDILKHIYRADAELRPLRNIVYSIQRTTHKNQSGLPIYRLYREDLYGPKQQSKALVEGIEKMDIRYGTPTGHSFLNYVAADAVQDWGQVKSLEITLRLSSIENVMSKPTQWKIAGKQQDRRLKREWRQVVMLRAREIQEAF